MGRFQGLPVICLCIFATVWYGQLACATKVTLENNVYKNVVVAISSKINPGTRSTIENALKNLLNSTSYALFNATEKRAWFEEIQVRFPPSWSGNIGRRSVNKRDAQWDGPYPSFETADFRVDIGNTAYGDMYPYAQQSGKCGEPGDFIHLTQAFIMDQDNLEYNGKLLALAWVKYRYGVFDEMGYKGSQLYPQMYYDSKKGAQLSICNNTGVTWIKRSPCSTSSNIQGLSDYCDLRADTTATSNKYISTSMMSPPLLPMAHRFCNTTTHNAEAPTQHNIMCNGQSVMDVILKHPDFAGKSNAPASVSTIPQIKIVSSDSPKNLDVVLIWDPMDYTRRSSAVPSLAKFIMTDFPDNSYFTIIQTWDSTNPYGVQIKSSNDRSDLEIKLSGLMPSDKSTTNIQQAVQTAIDTMSQRSPTTDYARALLVFSNAVTSSDLNIICQRANNGGGGGIQTQLHLVTYDATVAQYFSTYGSCPGRLFLIQAQSSETGMSADFRNCSTQLKERNVLDETLMNLPNTILPDVFSPPTVFLQHLQKLNSTTNGSFQMDVPPATMKTHFYAQSCINLGQCTATDIMDVTLRGKPLRFDSYANTFLYTDLLNETGTWDYAVLPKSCPGTIIPYSISAAGQLIPNSSGTKISVEVKAWVNVTINAKGNPDVRLFTSVKNGTTPIFNAKVMANITSSKPNTPVETVTLYDDGSGNPDTTAQDGVYSAYFTQLVKNAGTFSYSVTVNVSDNGVATIPTKQYTWITGDQDMGLNPVTPFTRTVQANPFTAFASGTDLYPPGPIRDFRVQSVSGQKVTVAWTAPGNDYDYGKATSYVFVCKKDRNALLGAVDLRKLTSDSSIPQADPAPAKTQQTATFSGPYDSTTYFCAMQAFDGQGQASPVSNIASYQVVSEGGLSTASIAGIVVGVILAIIALILLIVLLWYCLRDEPTKEPTPTGAHQLIVIPPAARQPLLTERKNSYDSDHTTQHSVAAPSKYNDDHSVDGSRYSHSRMGDPPPKSNSPSLVAVPLPTIPQNRDSIERQERPASDDYDLFEDANIAVPQKVPIKLAQIENVSEYHDARLQNRLPKPPSPPRSYSGSTSSVNTADRHYGPQI